MREHVLVKEINDRMQNIFKLMIENISFIRKDLLYLVYVATSFIVCSKDSYFASYDYNRPSVAPMPVNGDLGIYYKMKIEICIRKILITSN